MGRERTSGEVMIIYDRRWVNCRRVPVHVIDLFTIVRGVHIWSPCIYQARRLRCEGESKRRSHHRRLVRFTPASCIANFETQIPLDGAGGEDNNSIQDYNPLWVSELRRTNAYEVWERVTDPLLFDIAEPR